MTDTISIPVWEEDQEAGQAGDAIRREREIVNRIASRLLEYMRQQWPGLDECTARSAVQQVYERLGEIQNK